MSNRIESGVRTALENAFAVVITTRVGPCMTHLDGDGEFNAEPTAEGVVAQSTVDLARGDVFHTFDPAFLRGDAQELRAFHERAVTEAMQLPALRLTLLKEVAALLGRDPAEVLGAKPRAR